MGGRKTALLLWARLYARRLWEGRSTFSRAAAKWTSASPVRTGSEEMMQPCLIYLHVISLVARAGAAPVWASVRYR